MSSTLIHQADLGSNSLIQSIVGATFLKNVYSVYKYSGSDSGSQVGFASLSEYVASRLFLGVEEFQEACRFGSGLRFHYN